MKSTEKPKKISLPNVTMPSGGGALRGISEPFKSEQFTGSGTFSIPFALPDARGFSPAIALAYNTGSGNGLFGLGFSVAMDSVVRKTSTGIPKYDGSDVFILQSEGELLPKYTSSGDNWDKAVYSYTSTGITWQITAYRPRIEGSFSLIEHWADNASGISHWKVVTADNVTHLYGISPGGRIFDPNAPARIFEWLIESSTDAHGNKIVYSYKDGDTVNIPDTPYNSGREYTSQRYPDTISFGNYYATEDSLQVEKFAFEVLFDYGQADKANPDHTWDSWKARSDIFSTYKSGFEIRTARLCTGIYLRHAFTGENGGAAFTTSALLPEYGETEYSGISIIRSVSSRGYRLQNGIAPWIADTPPTLITYQGFSPQASDWQLLEAEAPGYLNSGGFVPVDLDGIGIDGLLYTTSDFTGYLEPLGNGRYAQMRVLDDFPVFRDMQSGEISIASLNGNSVLDVVVNDGVSNGYFEHSEGDRWKPFQPFLHFPVEYLSADKEMADLSGTGRADLLFSGHHQQKFYPSEGKAGFAGAEYAFTPAGFPVTGPQSLEELTGFSDFLGDGLSHRFRLCNGSLIVWPCLGHGNFGAAVMFANAPDTGSLFDASRTFLVDADGSGATDIVYCYPGFARIWFNQNGNTFSAPVDVVFPATYSSITSVTSGDVTGYGTTSLIFTAADPEVRHFYYDFSRGQKPYILSVIDNGAGGLSSFTYTTSVLQQLADKQQGRIWPTRVPMPVSVVSESSVTDQLTDALFTSRYSYHDGYFDPVEREFRGFGFVESWDCESYESFASLAQSRPKMAELIEKELWMPPVYTRQWFITGAYEQTPAILAQYEQEFFNGDAEQWKIPAFTLDTSLYEQQGPTIRQAYASLAGITIRTEVYAEDGSSLQQNPYTVSLATTEVRLVQPRINERFCCLMHSTVDGLEYIYDRNPDDPIISQTLVLMQDEYGQPLLGASVNYPRRDVENAVIYPEQQQLRILASEAAYINTINVDNASPESYWQYLGINYESRGYEIGGIAAPAGVPFTRAALLQNVLAALQQPISPAATKPQTAWSRLLSWDRSVYWNADGTAALPYGEVSTLALLHHSETVVMDPEEVTRSFGDKVNNTMLTDNGGYALADGYWWDYGQMESYNWTAETFYLPASTQLTITTGTLSDTVLNENGFNGSSSVQYDDYYLLVTQSTSVLSAAISVSQTYQYDYQAMAPLSLMDANNNVSEALYDPLGRIIVTSIHGEIGPDDTPVGDSPLSEYNIHIDATFDDVTANPAKYLQGATTYFYYGLFAWTRDGQPLNNVGVTRMLHVAELTAAGKTATDTQMPITISYSNGLGGALQNKGKTTPGAATLQMKNGAAVYAADGSSGQERWLVSGYTVYNNKGEPVEQYLPYFSATPDFENQQTIIDEKLVPPPTVIHYDPIGRVLRTDSPKGFFIRTIYGAWETKSYDFNDTMPDSPYYQWFMANYPAEPAQWQQEEKAALESALPCYNTPSTVINDNLGNTIRTVVCGLGAISAITLPEQVTSPVSPTEMWDSLITAGYLVKNDPDDTVAWVAPSFQPYTPGFHAKFVDQFPENGSKVEDFLAQSCMTSLGVYDIQGRQLAMADARLFLAMVRSGNPSFNFTTEYGMGGQALTTESADAGRRWTLGNIAGKMIRSWDSRGFETQTSFDNFQRPIGVHVSGGDAEIKLDNDVQVTVYGETATNAAKYNLVGQPWQDFDESGLSIADMYGLSGGVLEGKAYLRADYKTEANWTAQAQQDILSATAYARRQAYNVMGQPLVEILPDGSRMAYTYDINGMPASTGQQLANPVDSSLSAWQTVITDITYDATGKRTRFTNGAGITTSHTYDELTQQLVHVYSARGNTGKLDKTDILQDIYYTYDPAGHVISSVDNNAAVIYYNNQQALPRNTYQYDPLYRIISAQGRAMPGIGLDGPAGMKDQLPFLNVPPNTDQQKLENYTQKFAYDFGDNLVTKRHIANSNPYTQVMTVAANSNHLENSYVGNESQRSSGKPQFTYDANGNMRVLYPGSTAQVSWNYMNQLSAVTTITREVTELKTKGTYTLNDAEYYQYNSSGIRVRKVSERAVQGGQYVEYTEKIYLGNFQQSRTYRLAAGVKPTGSISPVTERYAIVVKDGDAPALISHVWVIAPPVQEKIKAGDVAYRYQLCDPLDSVTMEVNGNAEMLTFEQYYVYGGTSFSLARSQLEADSKELRFCGKELDIVTGLYYYGARYYATWLCRWMSPDPAGPADGPNMYEYVGSNPVNYNDPSGTTGNGKPDLKPTKTIQKKKSKRRDKLSGLDMDTIKKTMSELKKVMRGETTGSLEIANLINRLRGGDVLLRKRIQRGAKDTGQGMKLEISNEFNQYKSEYNRQKNAKIQKAYKELVGPISELPDEVYQPDSGLAVKGPRKYYENKFMVTSIKQKNRSEDVDLKTVMNDNFHGSHTGPKLTATDFYEKGFKNDNKVGYAFCHLHAYIQGGANERKNIVYASEHANWVQLALEKTVQKMAVELNTQVMVTVRAKVYLNSDNTPSRIASKLLYIVHPETPSNDPAKTYSFTISGDLDSSSGVADTGQLANYIRSNYKNKKAA